MDNKKSCYEKSIVKALWRSSYAEVCKTSYAGAIPVGASSFYEVKTGMAEIVYMSPTILAGCVIVDDYDRILLLHRNTKQFQHWELPGGKVERGETAEAAAVRELEEELGVKVRLVKALGNEEFEDAHGHFRYYWFQAEIVGGEPEVQESDKFDDFDYFDLEDLLSLSLSANMQVLLPKLASAEIQLD